MASQRIQVRAKPGRKAFTAPKGGKEIPADDAGILVERTAWIQRLIDVHGDIEIVPAKPVAAKAKPEQTGDASK